MNIKNLPFQTKLYILVLPALLAFLWYSGSYLRESYSIRAQMTKASTLIELSVLNNQLVHELQKERGETALFLTSKKNEDQQILAQQQTVTDRVTQQRQLFINANQVIRQERGELGLLLSDIEQQLAQLADMRRQVNGLAISSKAAISYYTKLNTLLLSTSAIIAQQADNPEIMNQAFAYFNFLQAKERAGIERAVLSQAFSLGKFTPSLYRKYVALVNGQQLFTNNFVLLAKEENKAFYQQAMTDAAVTNVMQLRQDAENLAQGKEINVLASYWFKQATGRINQLKAVEDYIAKQLLDKVEGLKAESSFNFFITLFVLISILGLVVSLGIYIAKILLKQVTSLRAALVDIQKNNLAARAEVYSEDELGHIAQILNQTMEHFSTMIEEISSNSVQLASSVEEISTTVSVNVGHLNTQQDQTTQVATAIEQMTSSSAEIAANTHDSVNAASQANQLAEGGASRVTLANDKISHLAQRIVELEEQIIGLRTSSANISSVIDVIKGVAEQTNLLALNAAIEAARAGEQGRGFSVVADEVRTLAQRTQESTVEIEGIIVGLLADVGVSSTTIEACKNDALEVVAESSRVAESLIEISSSITHISDLSQQISAATEEQLQVSENISANISDIDMKSQESVEGIQQIALATQEQTQMASSLQLLAGNFVLK